MKPLVYLIGRSANYINKIEMALGNGVNIQRVSRSDLMSAIFKRMPRCIIIVEDDLDMDGFHMVDSTISLEYIPVICVSFSKEEWQIHKYIQHASYMNERDMDLLLPALVQQASQFSKKFHDMHITLDTYDVMNEAIRGSIVEYMEEDEKFDQRVLMTYLSTVYVENFFVDNRPMTMWILKKMSEDHYRGFRFPVAYDNDYLELNFVDGEFDFTPFKETGFFKNESDDEVSDIEEVAQLIPYEVTKHSEVIDNVACYAMDEIMLVAMNYSSKIRQRDLNILKALTIKLDLMINIKDKVVELEESFDYTMNALARAAEGKDDVTGHHIKRVNYYSRVIAIALNQDRRFVKNIVVAAQMHDVGKIFIPESVLNKPGKLTDEEFDLIKTHTTQGQVIIGDSENLQMAARIAGSHHERYDGTGYPDGLAGTEIPLEARIVFLADIYDALRSDRPYKRGFTHEESVRIITEGDGRVEPRHFDPSVLAVFEDKHLVFNEIFESLRD